VKASKREALSCSAVPARTGSGILNALGTETLLVGGISTQRSVEGTARDARNRDMQCIVVSDCYTVGELEIHELTIKHVLRRERHA
jgi:nicotinamidase-related amidase